MKFGRLFFTSAIFKSGLLKSDYHLIITTRLTNQSVRNSVFIAKIILNVYIHVLHVHFPWSGSLKKVMVHAPGACACSTENYNYQHQLCPIILFAKLKR